MVELSGHVSGQHILLGQMNQWAVISDDGEALLWLPLQITSDSIQTP